MVVVEYLAYDQPTYANYYFFYAVYKFCYSWRLVEQTAG